MLVCPYDDEIGVALVGDAHKRFRRGPNGDFRFPDTMEGGWHEIAELAQGFYIVVMEHYHRLE
jgi:hypothetical protein